jgi:hypothetical protein
VLDTNGPGEVSLQVADGLHFVELEAQVTSSADHLALAVDGNQLNPRQTYAPMDAPWGLLARLVRPLSNQTTQHLASTVAMAFFEPELGPVQIPNSVVWSGTLLAPGAGMYRMAFASEDRMHLELDGAPVNIVTSTPDGWKSLGVGSTLPLTAGPHRVQVTLDISHGGRDLARWNWVPPRPDGTLDTHTTWAVIPPWALRPDPSVQIVH